MPKSSINTIPSYSFQDTDALDKLSDILVWDRVLRYDFNKPHAHEFHEILFFLHGGGAHMMGDQWVEAEQYDIHILPSQYVHQMQRSPSSSGFAIVFASSFLSQLHGMSGGSSLLDMVQKPIAFNGGYDFFSKNSYYFKEALRQRERRQVLYNLLSIVLLNIHESFFKNQETKKASYDDFGVIFMNLLNSHFISQHKASFYATELGMCSSKLNQNLRKHFGKSFKDLHSDKLTTTAKQKVLHENANISEVAYQLGFADPAYFSRFFKKQTGQTPISYRNAH